MRKIIYTALMAASFFTFSSCESYLDVNTNPNGPDQVVMPHLYLSPILAEMALGIQFDGRYLGKYIANWHSQGVDATWDRHGYVTANDAAGQIWRSTYYTAGLNLIDMIKKAEEEKKWDFVAIGYALQAFNWQLTTDYHGEIIMSQAFDPNRSSFEYDSQEQVYAEVKRLAELALTYFEKAKAEPHRNSQLAAADLMYEGDIAKWEKFTYGLLAINAHHLSNKPGYDPAKVIDYVNKSFTSNAEDASIRFQGSVSADANFWGPMRGNLIDPNVRQSKFIVGLLDGTNPVLRDVEEDPELKILKPKVTDPVFAGQHLKDPRLPVMLAPAADGQYRGVAYAGVAEYTKTTERPYNLYGTATDASNATATGKYLFQNNARFPIMTYAQLQFIKAEAAYKGGMKGVALEAYNLGVTAHMDFVRSFAPAADRTVFDQRRAAYMANPKLMPAAAGELTLSHIMLQKYIAQWAWGFVETWSDLRRYHYTGNESGGSYDEIDTDAGDNVFRGFMLPTDATPALQYTTANGGKPAYRVRPRYNSEYIWNVEALRKIGGLEQNYHTKEMWFSKPQ